MWPRSTTVLLVAVGAVLAIITFLTVLAMPDLPWHSARDLELRATYDAYRDTGVLLVKPTGTGSWYTIVPGAREMSPAAWDDDPGAYLVASLTSHITGSVSPYPGLRAVMAVLCALPLFVLPLAVARIFRRARAGYALVLLPVVLWLVNFGTVLIGTEYGLSDASSPTRVYALYGMAASLVFLSLTLLLLLSTVRLSWKWLVGITLAFGVLGGLSNLMRSMSGVGVAAAVAVLWWLSSRRGVRLWAAAAGALVAVVISFVLPSAVMHGLDSRRADVTGIPTNELPVAHAVWHSVYLGLSYPEPITGEPSAFHIPWSDEYGWAKAREVNPDVLIASTEFDAIMKKIYLDDVRAHPGPAVRLYVEKALYTIKHFGAMIAVVGVGLVLALRRRGTHRRHVWAAVAIATPTLLLGMVPAVLVMPLLYYFSEISAALGLLLAVGWGGLVWAVTSLPSHVRAAERVKIASRLHELAPQHRADSLSVVVPTRNGATVVGPTVAALGGALGPDDEIIVVENGSNDDTTAVLEEISRSWEHPCAFRVLHSGRGLGVALNRGVLASSGSRLLLTADDLPFGTGDLEQFRLLPPGTAVAIGSKAHPRSDVHRSTRRTVQSRVFRFMRESLLHSRVGDSQGTIWVDGPWCRMFAAFAREDGLMWTTELVMAAEVQGVPVVEIPVTLTEKHDTGASRFSFGDAVRGLRGIVRLALQKDDYVQDEWFTGAGSETVGDRAVIASPQLEIPAAEDATTGDRSLA